MGRAWFLEHGSGRGQDVGGMILGLVFFCFKEEILSKTMVLVQVFALNFITNNF